MSTNTEELVQVNRYVAIVKNYEAENIFYIVSFTYVPYTLQDDVKPDGNKLTSGDLVFNAIYKSPGRHKSQFYVEPYKKQKCNCVNDHSCYSKSGN